MTPPAGRARSGLRGAPLFERLGRGVVLTEAGRAFLPHAEALLASMRDGLEAVAALRGADRGALTLAVVGTLASTTLSERLRELREAYPGIDLRLRTALSAEVSALVLRGDAALGLRYEIDPHPDLASAVVHEERLIPVCSAHHRFARKRRVSPRELAGERWIGFPARPDVASEPYSSAFEGRLAACGLGGAEIVPIDSLTAQKRMVEAGFGLALLPESSVGEELRAGTLRPLPRARHEGHDPHRADPSPAGVPERRDARADGDAQCVAGGGLRSAQSRNLYIT